MGDNHHDDHNAQEGNIMKIFGREPALVLGLIAAAIQLLSATLLPLTIGQQGALNAVAVAVIGFATAAAVSGDKAAPAVLGVVQAVLACALAFGLALSPELQGSVMAFVTALVSAFVRTQVVAPVPAPAVDQPVAG